MASDPDRRFGQQLMAIVEHNRISGDLGTQEILGLVRNDRTSAVSLVSVVAMCFDAERNPTTTTSGHTSQG